MPSSKSALDWIGRQPGKWFAWVHVYDPHATYEPPAEWAARFPSDPYLGEVSWTDFALGPLFDRLASSAAANARRSSPRITARASASTASSPTACSPTRRRCACRSSSRRSIAARAATDGKNVVVTRSGPPRRSPADDPRRRGSAGGARSAGGSLLDVVAGRGVRSAVVLRGDDGDGDARLGAAARRARRAARNTSICRSRSCTTSPPIPAKRQNLAAGQPAIARACWSNTLKTFNMAPPGRAREETAETIERLRSLGYIGGGNAARPREATPKRTIPSA